MAIDPKQLPEQPVTITFTVQARIWGVEGPLTINGASMRDVVRVVRGLGEVPQIELIAPTPVWQTLPDGTPICPKHGTPMRKREKQGDVWHSHNMGTEDSPCYCKGYRGADSPGYDR
ncbi:MAG: hypothetical protein WCG26_01435 [Chloroflexales bacterium]